MNSYMVLLLRQSLLIQQPPQNRSGRLVSIYCDFPTLVQFLLLYPSPWLILIQPRLSYPCVWTSSPGSVSSLITRRADFEPTIYDAYRTPSNSFPPEDDAIYGDAGGTTPTDANGDANGESEEEDPHESDVEVEEEEEDSEDVSHPLQTRYLS